MSLLPKLCGTKLTLNDNVVVKELTSRMRLKLINNPNGRVVNTYPAHK